MPRKNAQKRWKAAARRKFNAKSVSQYASSSDSLPVASSSSSDSVPSYSPSVTSLDGMDDWRARSLATKIQNLETQLKQLQSDGHTLQRKFEDEVKATLQSALDSLHLLVAHVAAVDKSVLFWYRRGTPLRLCLKVLKPVGRDRDALTIMTRKGGAIRRQADRTSGAFAACSDVCHASLVQVQQLHVRTNDFVQVGIGGAQNEAQDLTRDYECKKRDLQLSIDRKGLNVAGVELEASRASRRADDLDEQRRTAERAASNSKKLGVGGILGGILLGGACVLFPPAGAVAAGIGAVTAGAVGISSAVVSSDHSADARRFQSEQDVFDSRVSSLQYEIRGLRREMNTLESSKSGFDSAIRSIKTLEESCAALRGRTNQFLGEVNTARSVLSGGVTKTQSIAAALQRCEYARTRRDFVARVEGVLEELQGSHQIASQQPKLALLAGQLSTLNRKTDGVARIMAKCL